MSSHMSGSLAQPIIEGAVFEITHSVVALVQMAKSKIIITLS